MTTVYLHGWLLCHWKLHWTFKFPCTDRWPVSNLNLSYCRAEKRNRGLWHSISFRDLFRSIVGQSFQVNRLKITGHDRFLRYLKFVKSTGPPIQYKNTQPQGNLPSFKVNFIYIKMQHRCMKMLIRIWDYNAPFRTRNDRTSDSEICINSPTITLIPDWIYAIACFTLAWNLLWSLLSFISWTGFQI